MPCSIPGHLQSLAGQTQGQKVRGRSQDAAVRADRVMSCRLKGNVVPLGNNSQMLEIFGYYSRWYHELKLSKSDLFFLFCSTSLDEAYLRTAATGRENGERVASGVDLSDLIRKIIMDEKYIFYIKIKRHFVHKRL